jgi:hypothetical protein
MLRNRWIVVAFALGLRLAPNLMAQSQDSFAFDATLGRSIGSGGRRPYLSEDDIATEITLGFVPHPDRASAWMAAFTVGRRSGPLALGDLPCIVQPGVDSGCEPRFPTFSHVGFLGGRELRASHIELRALAGPAWYGGGGASGLGAQLHVDAAVGFRHLALVGAARWSWVERVTGESLRCRSIEFGLRIQ